MLKRLPKHERGKASGRRYSERKRAVDNPVHAEQGGECAGLMAVAVCASGRRYLAIPHLSARYCLPDSPIGTAYIRARLHVVSAYPVIDRSPRLAVASSRRFFPLSCFGRRFNIIYVFGKKCIWSEATVFYLL